MSPSQTDGANLIVLSGEDETIGFAIDKAPHPKKRRTIRALKKCRHENGLNDKAAKAANMLSEFLAEGEMFEEGRVRYYEAIRNGDIADDDEFE